MNIFIDGVYISKRFGFKNLDYISRTVKLNCFRFTGGKYNLVLFVVYFYS